MLPNDIRKRGLSPIHTYGVLILLDGVAAIGVVRGGQDFVRRSTRIALRQGSVGSQNYDISPMTAEVLKSLSDANLKTWEVERRMLGEK